MQLTALALWLNTAFAGFDEAVATAIHQLYVAAGWFFTPFLSFISLLGQGRHLPHPALDRADAFPQNAAIRHNDAARACHRRFGNKRLL